MSFFVENKKMWVRLILSVVFVLLLAYFVSQAVKIEDLREVISSFDKSQLIIFLSIAFAINVLKAFRFLILLREREINISFWQTLKAFTASQTTTSLPGGEAFRGVLVKRHTGDSLIKVSGPVISQGYLELLAASIVAVLGSIFLENDLILPMFLGGLIIGLFTYIVINEKLLKRIFKFLPDRKFVKNAYEKISFLQKEVKLNIFDSRKIFLKVLSLSLLVNILGGLLVFLIARSFMVNLDFFRSTLIYSSSVIIQGLLGISPGGLGFTEGGLTGILLLFNVDFAKALGIVIIFRAVTLLFGILLGLLFLIIFYGRSFILSNLSISQRK